jgi:hypothetical protein
MIEPGHSQLPILRQCELVSISRSGFYRRPAGESPLNLALMRLIDAQFLETPWYGSRQMARHLQRGLSGTYGPPRLQVVCAFCPDPSAPTYPVSGSIPGQDGDPRVLVLIIPSASLRQS